MLVLFYFLYIIVILYISYHYTHHNDVIWVAITFKWFGYMVDVSPLSLLIIMRNHYGQI